MQGESAGVQGVSLSGDGRLVLSGGVGGAVRLWEAVSGQAITIPPDHTAAVQRVAISGDGLHVASGSYGP